jgi:hypothetical protein
MSKKPLGLLLVTFLQMSCTFGQVSMEVSLGANYSSRSFRGPTNDYHPALHHIGIFGINANVFVDYQFSDILGLGLGMSMNSRGYSYQTSISHKTPYVDTSYDFSLHRQIYYLDIPLFIKGYYEVSRNTNLIGWIGPYTGFALLGRYDYFTGYANLEEFNMYTERKTIKISNLKRPRWDLGLNLRAGVEHRNITFCVAYTQGFINQRASYGNMFLNEVVVRNWAISLSLGYRFRFKHI